jgi:acetyl-CoA/propionyl-CoA carboxylase biotin carboxyl carrier protein
MRACRELGLRCIAVYSEADRGAPHVVYADEAYLLGPGPSTESYLNIAKIIEVARQSGAGAIHPGYGFLAENVTFAQAVAHAGLVFVGPPPEAMERMGGKTAARREAIAAGVPVVPGVQHALANAAEMRLLADEFGYPVIIKAVSGGGGRGQRVVQHAGEVEAAFDSARREAEAAFHDGSLYIEKFMSNPRHIEIQVLADMYGNAVHLGERDCSVQRRNQKLIEETPSPALSAKQRDEMGAAAVRLAQSVGYVSAGTLEFMYQDGQFYFLEMNTRIQVEHTVTEMRYGIDLVKGQLRIAQGEKLWFTQDELIPRGHAIECRINAEDPTAGFRPALGTIGSYAEPSGLGVRVDSGVRAGWTIPPFYDSLLSKLITWAETRDEAIARMQRALKEYQIEGVITTIPFYQAALAHPIFVEGNATINFIAQHPELAEQAALYMGPKPDPLAAAPTGEARTFDLEVNGKRFSVKLFGDSGAHGENGSVAVATAAPAVAGRRGAGSNKKASLLPKVDGVISPIQGRVALVKVEPGAIVEAGQVCFVVEAMKMENEITAPHAGILGEIRVKEGVTVEAGAVLATYNAH